MPDDPQPADDGLGDLPGTLPIFPLPGAVLFPRSVLPLNIFEPRYLNMIDDARAGRNMIGMIQTATDGLRPDLARPELARVGCAGVISSFRETGDGRYLITLTGISRFLVGEELGVRTPYRMVTPDWTPFAADLRAADGVGIDRTALGAALSRYADAKGLAIEWSAAEEAPIELLVNAIAAACPFQTGEKQALLEARDLNERADVLIALLTLDAAPPPGAARNLQ